MLTLDPGLRAKVQAYTALLMRYLTLILFVYVSFMLHKADSVALFPFTGEETQ